MNPYWPLHTEVVLGASLDELTNSYPPKTLFFQSPDIFHQSTNGQCDSWCSEGALRITQRKLPLACPVQYNEIKIAHSLATYPMLNKHRWLPFWEAELETMSITTKSSPVTLTHRQQGAHESHKRLSLCPTYLISCFWEMGQHTTCLKWQGSCCALWGQLCSIPSNYGALLDAPSWFQAVPVKSIIIFFAQSQESFWIQRV